MAGLEVQGPNTEHNDFSKKVWKIMADPNDLESLLNSTLWVIGVNHVDNHGNTLTDVTLVSES